MGSLDVTDLRHTLDELLREPTPSDAVARAKLRALIAAVISEALRRRGMQATLVGGGAIEFHAPGAYATEDLDLVVERLGGVKREAVADCFRDLGFGRLGRHWERAGVFVEVPGVWMEDPVEEHRIGDFTLRVVRPEVVLADRVVGFKHWRYTAYGLQTIAMLGAFGDAVDSRWLLGRLEREDAVDAYHALRKLAAAAGPVTDAALHRVLEGLERHRAPAATRRRKPPSKKRR